VFWYAVPEWSLSLCVPCTRAAPQEKAVSMRKAQSSARTETGPTPHTLSLDGKDKCIMADCNCSTQENSSGFSPSLMTERDAALMLAVSAQTLRNWRCIGRGPKFLRLGGGRRGLVRYQASDIQAYLRDRILGNSGQCFPLEG